MEYRFKDIAGYEEEKAELKQLCSVINDRKRVQELGGEIPRGIIFYGGPGTGKTLFARVMASECGLQIIDVDIKDVDNSVQICRRIRRAFDRVARARKKCMIFFDELDKVIPNAAEHYVTDQSKTVLTQLLTSIDGMDPSRNFIFVATCNDYNALPPSLVRPGRIDKKVFIGEPSFASRVQILELYAQKTLCRFEIGMDELAKLCSGFSGAALKTLINECVLQSDANGFISKSVVTERILEIKNEDIPRGKSTVSDMINAYRNLGAFVVARTLNHSKYIVNLESDSVGNSFFNKIIGECNTGDDDDYYYGYHPTDEDEPPCDADKDDVGISYFCKNDYLNTICVLLGGYAAQEAIVGKTYDNLAPYLSYIDSILFTMSKNGMFGVDNVFLSWRDDSLPYTDAFTDRLNGIFADTVAEQYRRAKEVVDKNVDIIRRLTPVLVDKSFVDDKVCEPIIKEMGGLKT